MITSAPKVFALCPAHFHAFVAGLGESLGIKGVCVFPPSHESTPTPTVPLASGPPLVFYGS